MNELFFFSPLDKALNIKSVTAVHLARLGLHNVRDLLFHVPYAFNKRLLNPNISFLKQGDNIIVDLKIEHLEFPSKTSVKSPIKITGSNDTGTITLNYFNKIPAFILQKFKIGSNIRVAGVASKYNYHISISHPEILSSTIVCDLEPCYHLTYGITNQQISNYVQKLLACLKQIDLSEWLPQEIILRESLPSFKEAIFYAHNLSSEMDSEKYQKRLKYDELFANQIALSLFRKQNQSLKLMPYTKATEVQNQILAHLGFELTLDQNKVIEEIEHDQASSNRMMRLLQGDVGSGKTIVALMTMVNALSANRSLQTALMAPTDILASQHYIFFKKALEDTEIQLALLTGKTKQSDKTRILQDLALGKIQILIGTHALFQDNVIFQKLTYAVIDEQHRFGVNQRAWLTSKGENADFLIMTATPIPRSLCLTLFGDMVSSKINSKPKNRIEIKTSVMHVSKIEVVIEQIKSASSGIDRVYWVCPLVKHEEGASEDFAGLMSATKRFEILAQIFGNKVGLIHGKMKAEEKELAMQRFKAGELFILVATTVIEVGIDVPEANLIIIENAERFGLATLHQLRGRVGRGNSASFCILIYDYPLSAIAKERLKIMKESSDGFEISEKDLELRGGGEILGTKQSGEQNFIFINLPQDQELLSEAHRAASMLSLPEIQNRKLLIKLFNYTAPM